MSWIPTLERSFAQSPRAKNWDYSNKEQREPKDFFISSNKKKWFLCECGHKIEIRLVCITNGNWCPFCSIPPQKLCQEDCNICFLKSFAQSSRAKNWDYSNVEQGLPRDFSISSAKKKWFLCEGCGHKIEIRLNSITSSNAWCSYCANRKLCQEDCTICFLKSFTQSPRAKNWDYSNIEQGLPRDYFISANIKKWFLCEDCDHKIEISLNSITTHGSWCPYCANQKLCQDECDNCFQKSFAQSPKAKNWDYSNIKQGLPRDYFISTAKKKYFICENNHSFKMGLSTITSGSWCPLCINKTEMKLYEWLIQEYPDIKTQVRFEWCKKFMGLPFDFVLDDKKIIIELDGRQHFTDIIEWKSNVKDTQIIDKYKMLCALQNGYTMIRIYQPDILYDKIDWKTSINLAIYMHTEDHFCMSYIASNPNMYNNHRFKELDDIIE